MLLTGEGSEIVRYFGVGCEIVVAVNVRVLSKSCFEQCRNLESIVFDPESKLTRIGRSAIAGCELLTSVEIPASVEVIEASAFKGCQGLEYCSMDEKSVLVRIGMEAFAECDSIRSFDVPRYVEEIGQNCFRKCTSLSRLRFGSDDSLTKMIGFVRLDQVLENMGFKDISTVFRIEFNEAKVGLGFPGWVSVDDGSSNLTLLHDIR
jgi:hypothetical protein